MSLKGALLAIAAGGAFLLIAACGGGDVSDSNGSTASSNNINNSNSTSDSAGSNGSTTTVPVVPAAAGDGNGSGGNSSQCQRLSDTTFIGGNLFVAEQGPVVITLLSDGGLTDYWFTFRYDNVFGLQGVSNPQNRWGSAYPFPVGTPVGTSITVELQPPPADLPHTGTLPIDFPKGIPVELWLTTAPTTIPRARNSSSTASIDKDVLGTDRWKTASVRYGPNNTATVGFFATTEGPYFTVGLSNVYGSGCATMPAQP